MVLIVVIVNFFGFDLKFTIIISHIYFKYKEIEKLRWTIFKFYSSISFLLTLVLSSTVQNNKWMMAQAWNVWCMSTNINVPTSDC